MMKVLIVEHRSSERFIAKQLLDNYGLDFTWQSVASKHDLQNVTRDFAPGIILCADEMLASSQRAELDLLRLLAPQAPTIMVCEMAAEESPPWHHADTQRARLTRLPQRLQPIDQQVSAASCMSLPSALDAAADVVVMSDADGWLTYASPRACALLAADCEATLCSALTGKTESASRAANWYDVAMDDSAEHAERFVRAARPHGLAFMDETLQVHRRVHLSDLIGRLNASAAADDSGFPLVAINLDGLGLLNQAYGRMLGDDVLNLIRQVLTTRIERGGVAARVGEDDFLFVLPDVEVEAVQVAAPALFSINQAPPDAVPRLQVETDLGDAIRRQALRVHFQPQFEVESGRGCGVEALARWFRSSGECITPAVFIPVAERVGMIHTLGAWVLQNACETAAAWRGREAQTLTVSVNVSTLQINHRYCKVLSEILAGSGFPAARLELEIAESALIANSDLTIDCLKQWKRLGVRIAVSHYGTDYSSLSYLSRLSIDRLKLNKSLIRDITTNQNSVAVTDALISLGAALGIDVIAEGVETTQQFEMLRDLGCRQVQGFLLGRPMPDVQTQVALRKTWGNFPRQALQPNRASAVS